MKTIYNEVECETSETYPFNEGIYNCFLKKQKLLEDGNESIPLLYNGNVVGVIYGINIELSPDKQKMKIYYTGVIWLKNLKPYIDIDGVNERIAYITIDKVNGEE